MKIEKGKDGRYCTRIDNVDELRRVLDAEPQEFSLMLNFGLFSRKRVDLLENGKFCVFNYIDSEQTLTAKQLMDKTRTNIGAAIDKGAFWMDGPPEDLCLSCDAAPDGCVGSSTKTHEELKDEYDNPLCIECDHYKLVRRGTGKPVRKL